MKAFFCLIILSSAKLVFFASTVIDASECNYPQSVYPRASIFALKPDTDGSVVQGRQKLPISVEVAFDQDTSILFALNYFQVLASYDSRIYFPYPKAIPFKQINSKHFVITISNSLTEQELQKFIDKANLQFNNELALYEQCKKQKELKVGQAAGAQAGNDPKTNAQSMLHAAIVNNSITDIKRARELGANINSGVGNQPPLLLAVLLGKKEAAQVLLDSGANPNITYLDKPLIFYIIRNLGNWPLALLFLQKGATLLDRDNAELINYIMFGTPYVLDEHRFEVLQKLGYDLKSNFNSLDLAKNKWYLLLYNNFGQAGFGDPSDISTFLKHGANPNQVFTLPNGTSWTPLLLIINRYKANSTSGYIQTATKELLLALLRGGANINQVAQLNVPKKMESPLSYAIDNDKSGYIIEFLIEKGASLEEGVKLFVMNGGSPNKKIGFPTRPEPFPLLLWAIEYDKPDVVKSLIEAGADLNSAYFAGVNYPEPLLRKKHFTALQLAITKGYGDIIELLIKHGARA